MEHAEEQPRRRWSPIRIVAICAVVAILACIVGFTWYTSDCYHADSSARAALLSSSSVRVDEQADGDLVFTPAHPKAALVFYPGGKVEQRAYAPLMRAFAERGIACVLVKMPFNLAVLDRDAASGEKAHLPVVPHYYIGGHSLGGAMAASYAAAHPGEFDGLLLCAAYSTDDLSASGMKVLSAYGTCDDVLNRDRYEQCLSNLPRDTDQLVIDGGCHSYFGDYGMQKGDGNPTISRESQQEQVASELSRLVSSQSVE